MKKNTKISLTLHLVSDSTGETLKAVSSAAAVQFSELEYQQKTYPMVRTVTQLERVFKNIKEEKGVVFCTLVEEEVREKLEQFCKEEDILYLPVMENIVSILEEYKPTQQKKKPPPHPTPPPPPPPPPPPINYTLEHDDGQGQLDLDSADVIIVGVSRTSKTPTCIYLANQGIKAANYPLVPHVGISEELENIKNTQVVALITSAHTLVEIRRKRSIELGLNNTDNDYIDIHKVEEEITTAKRIFANKGWQVIDITRRSVEETASAIMNILSLKEEENVERE